MSPLDKTWRDEIIVIVFALPLLGIFIPFVDTYVVSGWEKLKAIDPTVPSLFVFGWGIIFAATFGTKAVTGLFRHSKFAALITAMGGARDDVPEDAAEEANDTANRDYGLPTGSKRLVPSEQQGTDESNTDAAYERPTGDR